MRNSCKILLMAVAGLSLSWIIPSEGLKGKIVCFGDSITFGAGVEGQGWPERLNKLSSDIMVVNAGRKGRKTSDVDELLPVIEKNLDADYFLFLLGVNDLKDGNDSLVNLCVRNIDWMIKKVKEKIPGVKIVLISPCQINVKEMSELNRNKKYNYNTAESLEKLDKKYKRLAESESVGFISLLNVVSQNNFLDGIHPNAEGYTEITGKIWNELSILPTKYKK